MEFSLFDRVRDLFDKASENVTEVSDALMVIEPVPPYGGRGAVTVLITGAALLSMALVSGVGLVSMVIMLMALAIIFMILTNVFGISFDVDPSEIFRYGGAPW
ncbi:MAG: hypothetical protein P9L99_18985 [Candidatus Lernaella stagnicola]|nr:hypothetical protein [Candidatus Lernaella stagnicola]